MPHTGLPPIRAEARSLRRPLRPSAAPLRQCPPPSESTHPAASSCVTSVPLHSLLPPKVLGHSTARTLLGPALGRLIRRGHCACVDVAGRVDRHRHPFGAALQHGCVRGFAEECPT